MWKALRWPLLALLFAIILLVAALYTQLANDENSDDANETPVSILPDTTPTPTDLPPATAIPTIEIEPGEELPEPVPGQLTEALVGRIGKLNPLYAEFNPVDRDITSLMFEGLTTVNAYGEVVPDLAERWEVSRDGLEYIVAIRRDVSWQDGVQFASADVRYTIDVIRDANFQGNPTLTEFWKTVEVAVIDDFTMRFRLVQPLASFPEQLRLGLLPAHALQGYPVQDLDKHPINLINPIGTGPYQLEEIYSSPNNGQIIGISLRVAPTYRQRPEGQSGYAIDRIVFLTYETLDQAIAAYVRGEVNSI
jgi:ABC-type transport system substrate-binding protein